MSKTQSLFLSIVKNDIKFNINNLNNVKTLKNFLNKIYKPIRYEYLSDIKVLTTFVKIIKYFDLPYSFDLQKKHLWRYNGIPYGAFFDKKIRSFVLYFSTGFKKNIGVSIQCFVNFPSKSNMYSPVDWHKFSFLYKKTLKLKNFNEYYINNNFNPINNFQLSLIPIYFYIFNKNFHRCVNLSDIDINPWVTTFDYHFWTHDIYDVKYKISNLPKVDYFWGVHEHFINPSFFVTSFDTRTILYPELYFKYISQTYNIFKYIKIFKSNNNNYNIMFYNKIINIYNFIYNKNIKKIFNNFIFLNSQKIIKNIKNFKQIIKKNKLKFILNFNYLIKKKHIFFNLYKNLYIYKSNFIKKNILLKNYYYYRSKMYNRDSPIKYNFRLNYIKKLPRVNKYMKHYTRYYSNIYYKKLYRVIFYNKYSKIITLRFKKFWNYFFIFFISNVKKRFFFTNLYINNINIIYVDYIYDLLLFIKKYFYFNLFLRKYFKKYFYLKKLKYNKKNIINNYI